MKNLHKELLSISKTVSELATQVEKLAQNFIRGDEKKAPVKKAKAPTKNKKTKVPAKAKRVAKKPSVKKTTPQKRTAPKGSSNGLGILDHVYRIISRSRKGVSVAQLRAKTDLEIRQVNNAIYKLKKKGKIEAISRGIYAKKRG